MGMYTEFIFGCALSENTPKICIDALDYFINGEKKQPKYENPTTYAEQVYNDSYIERTSSVEEIEDFIERYEFGRLFACDSYYFGAIARANRFEKDHIDGRYHISTRANCKNYEQTIQHFLEYIKPYIVKGSGPLNVYAYVHYEETDYPTIYSLGGGKIIIDKTLSY